MARVGASPEAKRRAADAQRRFRERHPEKAAQYRQEYIKSGRWREATMRRLYGIGREDYDRLLDAQGRSCGICKTSTPGHGRDWCIDHDHATGAVRGLLCNPCNAGLGAFRDSPVALRNAIAYLEASRGTK